MTNSHNLKRRRPAPAWGKILAASLLLVSSARVSFSRGGTQASALQIPPVRTTLKIENLPMTVSSSGMITMISRQQDQLAFQLELVTDLSEFQQNITAVLRSQLNKSDRCGEHIEIQHATLTPVEPASMITAQLHYERWTCTTLFGKQTAHRLVGGDAEVQMRLTPVVEDHRTVRLQPELGTITADGALGELLRTGPVEQVLRENLSQALITASEKGTNFSETLPPAVQGFVTVRNARFKDIGNGRLGMVLDGDIHITAEQALLLQKQLQERTSRAH